MKLTTTLTFAAFLMLSACATGPQAKTPTHDEEVQSDELRKATVDCMHDSIKQLDDSMTDASRVALAAAQQCETAINTSARYFASTRFSDQESVSELAQRITSSDQILATWTPVVLRLRASARTQK